MAATAQDGCITRGLIHCKLSRDSLSCATRPHAQCTEVIFYPLQCASAFRPHKYGICFGLSIYRTSTFPPSYVHRHNFLIVDGIRLALPSFESLPTCCIEAVRTSCLQLNRPASYLLQADSLLRATTLKHIWHQTIPVLVGWRKTLRKVCWSQHAMRRRPRKSPSLLSSHHQTRRNGVPRGMRKVVVRVTSAKPEGAVSQSHFLRYYQHLQCS
jgi:hypothetical protein